MRKILVFLSIYLICFPAFADSAFIAPTTVGTSLPGQIPGTTTNDNACTGCVGEYPSSSIGSGSAVALTTATAANVTSLSLTAGDWDVTINAQFASGTTTSITQIFSSLSLVSATLDATPGRFNSQNYPSLVAGTTTLSAPLGPYRITVASPGPTTVFYVARGVFTVSTLSAYGLLSARRVR